ncbi:MAG TPA: hypothetical protein VNZ26_14060 [Vicinamibacterales bacterium]|jgi:hypothetical protein|nr:hypothetical protein [Vicinamibacterales bacterium]
MKAMFANMTVADFGGHSNRQARAAERRRVHWLFGEIQIAIHDGDHVRVDYLMRELAAATGREEHLRASSA